ncbi:MAG TPA: helix-turn-helix domain-containing protein [Pyrinomonadaceae bacterium]|nr:helix-turn-helix domain-containing protein [Pyrinomonadaceae bacterium]
MNADRATAFEAIAKRRLRRTPSGHDLTHLRIAERSAPDRVQRLVDLAVMLLREAETLARDKAFTEDSANTQSFDINQGIDFYLEVERFETRLIKLALDHTGGNQSRAAKLLGIKPTTLNSKIKLYAIEY